MKNTPVLDEHILRTLNSGARLTASIMLELRPYTLNLQQPTSERFLKGYRNKI
jgi:hypothetical protein